MDGHHIQRTEYLIKQKKKGQKRGDTQDREKKKGGEKLDNIPTHLEYLTDCWVLLYLTGEEKILWRSAAPFHPQTFGMMTKKETDRAAEHDTISNNNCWPAANIFIRIGGGDIGTFSGFIISMTNDWTARKRREKRKMKERLLGRKGQLMSVFGLVWVSARLNGEKKWRNHLSRSVSAAAEHLIDLLVHVGLQILVRLFCFFYRSPVAVSGRRCQCLYRPHTQQ